MFDRRIKLDLLPTNIQLGGRHRDGRPPKQAKPITDEHSIRRYFRPPHQVEPSTDEHSVRRSSSRFSTTESSETYYRRTFNSALVIASFARRTKWILLPTHIQFGGRRRDMPLPNRAKPITNGHSIRRSSSRPSTAESNETYYRRTFNSTVVIVIFDRRIK
jgi:hypothetical protein